MNKKQPPPPYLTIGMELMELIREQSEWSQATFGTDRERGPVGALKHLSKEAKETIEAWWAYCAELSPSSQQAQRMEFADCLLLILDASRRAGIRIDYLIASAREKMKTNKARTWPKPISDEPVEHIRKDGVA